MSDRAVTESLIRSEINVCRNCELFKGIKNRVPGSFTSLSPSVVFVGEAPGKIEDETGIPFTGKAGRILRRWISELGIKSYAILNCVKCRPDGNRVPSPEELNACRPFLERQLKLFNPKLIVCLGKTAVSTIIPEGERIPILSNLGEIGYWRETRAMIFVHPSYCLRSGFKPDLNLIKEAINL